MSVYSVDCCIFTQINSKVEKLLGLDPKGGGLDLFLKQWHKWAPLDKIHFFSYV